MSSIPDRATGRRRMGCWFRVGSTAKYVVVRSRVRFFMGHFSGRHGRSLRCPGDGCPFCNAGGQPEAFTYVMVEDSQAAVLVWEISRRLRSFAQEVDDLVARGSSPRIQVWREGTASNSPIDARVVDLVPLDEIDIQPFVDTLGRWEMPADSGRRGQGEGITTDPVRVRIPNVD